MSRAVPAARMAAQHSETAASVVYGRAGPGGGEGGWGEEGYRYGS